MKRDETDRWLKRQEVEGWDDEIGKLGRRRIDCEVVRDYRSCRKRAARRGDAELKEIGAWS